MGFHWVTTYLLCVCLFLAVDSGWSLSASHDSRRSFLTKGCEAVAASSALLLPGFAGKAGAEDQESLVQVYFGCGCFWHVQHEFVEAERRILGRSDSQLSARAGYAGGKAGALNGKVCYHNAMSISDYGSLGHGEVVQLQIPPSKFSDFATEFCNLFSEQGYRPDQFGDRGPEYRNLVGIPGGVGVSCLQAHMTVHVRGWCPHTQFAQRS